MQTTKQFSQAQENCQCAIVSQDNRHADQGRASPDVRGAPAPAGLDQDYKYQAKEQDYEYHALKQDY